jgi:HPt (histidine-containing phosphotransfer) domain-containing protein
MDDKEALVYNLTIVKEASDDAEYLKEITGYFIHNSGEMIATLEKACNDGDWDAAQNAAHKLSSNFFMFGLDEGAKALSRIDINLLHKVNHEQIPDLISIAKAQGEKAMFQLKRDFHVED